MLNSRGDNYQRVFSSCRRILGEKTWGRILAALDNNNDNSTNSGAANKKDTLFAAQTFPDKLSLLKKNLPLPDFIDDLAHLEWKFHQIKTQASSLKKTADILPEKTIPNPSLCLLAVSWKHLAQIIDTGPTDANLPPEKVPAHVMIWRHPKTGEFRIRDAKDIDLLALKIIIEGIDPRQAAAIGNINVRGIHLAIDRAIEQGILVAPSSLIQRVYPDSDQTGKTMEPFLSANIFTLQWHITQACDLHCKHCYDRSDRSTLPYDTAIAILDDFYEFCQDMHIKGQVTFTGGNPLLYQYIYEIYQEAADRGFGIAILGNPTPAGQIEKLLKIAKPVFFQISIEGLAEHNDYIRGKGHFKRSLAFLDDLRASNIYNMVMLTLTRDNLDQVLPLSQVLAGRTDHFTFNRLSAVGEGKGLLLPGKKRFEIFLREYAQAAAGNPMLGLKDNLFNIICEEQGDSLFGGCTGFGCGAAFNFAALLPDGEVHACRKFSSPIGNMMQNRLIDIYWSDRAEKYRAGARACRNCRLNVVCRGCLAVTYSHGLDIFTDRDPFCFIQD